MQTLHSPRRQHAGFVIIEAMVALLLVAFAALAISKITTMVLQSTGDSRARSEANVLGQAKLERMRNSLVEGDFTASAPLGTTTEAVTGATAAFTVTTNVTSPGGGALQRRIEVNVAWTSATGEQQAVNLSSEVAWGNAENQPIANSGGGGGTSAITPRGAAKRINKDYGTTKPDGATSVSGSNDKAYVKKAGDVSELIIKVGDKYLGVLQTPGDFSKIQGNVYFDPAAKQLPNMNTFDLRLSSEGECVYNSDVSTATTSANSKTFAYFGYTCFVGTGWYGNIGLSSRDLQGKSFQTCVGDPAFTAVAELTSPHGDLSPIRTYRGFEQLNSKYLSTGMANNSAYPNTEGETIYGKPTPTHFGYSGSGLADQFNQHFFVTSISGQATCQSVMPTTIFAKNAGKFLCISPDNSTNADHCPDVWPNFEGYVAGGGSGGGGGSTCITVISGSTPTNYPNNKAKITISSTATCNANGAKESNGYSCTGVTAAQGTTLTLTLVDTTNKNPAPTLTMTTTATCDAKTVNF